MKSMAGRHPQRHFLAACVVLVSCWFVSSGQNTGIANPDWREFKSEAGGFSVKFPGTPRIGQDLTERGPLSFRRYTHTLSLRDGISFEADYMDMPAGSRDSDLILEGSITGFARPFLTNGATLLTRETIVRGTCQGRDLTLLNPTPGKPGFVHARVFNSGQRYYFIVFVSETEDNAAVREMARTFVESFSVTGGCTTAIAPAEAPSGPKKVENVQGITDPATGWRKIDRKELGFSVLMPGAVQYETAQAQVQPIPLMHHNFIYEGERAVYTAEVFGDYPPKFYSTPASYLNVLDATVYGLKRNLAAEGFDVVTLRDLKVEQFPGREFSIASEELGAHGRAQVFVTGTRVYIFIGFTIGKVPAATTLDRFFTSVRVSPK